MSAIPIRRALIAVYDKTGIAEFAKALVEEYGIEIISTGGTAKHLKEAGIPVTMVEEVTGFPEMLDGRVKTLHPKIHAGILADRDNPEHMRQLNEHGIKPIDMVVVNLYPFEETVKKPDCKFEDAIEMIDIGGPCMLRAAAKNHKHVLVVFHPDMYNETQKVIRSGLTRQILESHAACTFLQTCRYDEQVTDYFTHDDGRALWHNVHLWNYGELRYGENSHQQASKLAEVRSDDQMVLTRPHVLRDSLRDGAVQLSFNNYVDADAALGLCAELARSKLNKPTCVFIKHTNACGVGISNDPKEAYRQAYLGDPNAAMGGILAVNFAVDKVFAETLMATLQLFKDDAIAGGCANPPQAFFAEVIVAPGYDDDAIEVIRTAKKWGERVRLLDVGDMTRAPSPEDVDYKRIAGGMLMQTPDLLGLNEHDWKIATDKQPTDAELNDARLAWLTCKHTKSNAITICKDGMPIGNGAGQMSRVMSCRIATWLAKENGHAAKLAGSVAASDAFFPFRDGLDILADAGVTTVIQPGGSKRDDEVIAAANERGIAMILTGTRHFKH